jgi:small subunit ribosomal protein S21
MKNYHKNVKNKKNLNGEKGGEGTPVITVNDKFAHIEAVQAQPLEVKVYGNTFDKALRAFRALVQKERILSTYKEKQTYEKPSDKKRRKRNEAKRKLLELCSRSECKHPEHINNKAKNSQKETTKRFRRNSSE